MKVTIAKVPDHLKEKRVADVIHLVAHTLPGYGIIHTGPWGQIKDSLPLTIEIVDPILDKLRELEGLEVEEASSPCSFIHR